MKEFQGKMLLGEWKDVELRKNKLWVIVTPLIWIRPNGTSIGMTPYLITDYATIPKIFWPIIPKRSVKYDIAAAFHDDCMRYRKLRNMSKRECHDIFKEIMKYNNTPKWQYTSMYTAVNLAGLFTRASGYGDLPWKLSSQEIQKYNTIKRQHRFTDLMLDLKSNDYLDEFEIYS